MGSYMLYYVTGIIMVPVIIFALICQINVKNTFNKYSRVRSVRGMTGAQAAESLLRANGITDVKILSLRSALPAMKPGMPASMRRAMCR